MTMPADVAARLAAIPDKTRRADALVLVERLAASTGWPPELAGTLIGFGRYAYRYESGHEGETCVVGLAPRKAESVLYLLPGLLEESADLLARLGPHRTGKGCLYLKKLDGVDLAVLDELFARCVTETRRRYPDGVR